jgi:hypothetical protein
MATIFSIAYLLGVAPTANAELVINSSVSSVAVKAKLTPLFETVIRPYGDAHSAPFPYLGGVKGKGTFTYYEGSNFEWVFNDGRYLSDIAAFVPDATQLEDCKPDKENPLDTHCDQIRERHWVCHLFMFDSDLALAAVSRIEVGRDRRRLIGKPFCQSVKAMSVAKEVPDAMLITLGYSDSAEPADPRNDSKEFVSTVLLRFSTDAGKLKIEQDDSCLGNPNKYATIVSARKALKTCAASQSGK